MTDNLTLKLYFALVLISTVMFIWTVNYVHTTNSSDIPTAITAFNG